MRWPIAILCFTLWLGGLLPAIAAQKERTEPGRNYNTVYFWTADAGLVGDVRELVLTRDGGQTWTPILSIYGPEGSPASIDRLGTLNSQVWWFEDSGNFWQTTDQGRTWTMRPSPDLGQLVFVARDEAWAIGPDNDALAHTWDGGRTWQRKALMGVQPRQSEIVRLYFVSPTVGWIEAGDNSLLRTTDAGQTWVTRGSLPSRYPFLYFLDDSIGYALDIRTTAIAATHDGGATWQSGILPGLPHNIPLQKCFILDSRTAWAVGIWGTILRTTDGGATWQSQTSGTGADLFGIQFIDREHGWAVGHYNTILKTADGGQTWVKVDDDLKQRKP
jgi:photosystem II stability/assembly factor-like uncharacterized protein